jgi:transporter family-2 protein
VAVGSLGTVDRIPDATAWHLVGGLASSLYITAGILLFPRLGALVAVGLFITGQVLASAAVDDFGLLGEERRPLGVAGAAGALLVLAGARAITRTGASGAAVPRRGAWVGLGLAAGAGLALQGPVNAALRQDLDAPVAAGAFSFLVATAAMLLVLAAWQAATRAPRPHAPGSAMPWWGWAGGLVGATYVTTIPLLIPEIGAATTIGLTVAGQQLASLAVDRWGLLRLARRPLTRTRLAGVAALLVGVGLLQVR